MEGPACWACLNVYRNQACDPSAPGIHGETCGRVPVSSMPGGTVLFSAKSAQAQGGICGVEEDPAGPFRECPVLWMASGTA